MSADALSLAVHVPGSADAPTDAVDAALQPFAASLSAGDLGALLVALGAPLTSADGHVRRRATALMAAALERAAEPALLARPRARLRTLLAFVLERLASDFPSALPLLRACRTLLRASAAADADAGASAGAGASGGEGGDAGLAGVAEDVPAAVAICRTLFREVNVRACEQPLRSSVFQLLEMVATTPAHVRALLGLPAGAEPYALDFAAGFAQAMEGEKDPRCLLVCLRCAAALLSAPLGEATAQLAEELFEVTACYFPITFTPPPNDPHGITREALSTALARVFGAAPRLAPHALPLMLEKLGSSAPDAKREALRTLRLCAAGFGVEGLTPSLVDVAASLRKELVGGAREPGVGAGAGAGPAQPAEPAADARHIGALAGEVGLDFRGPRAAASGFSLFDRSATASAGPGPSGAGALRARLSAAAGPGISASTSVADEALDAICEVARVLAVSSAAAEARAPGAPPPRAWADFSALMLRSCATEVERAAESPAGRGAARVLCAVASAHPFAASAVLALAMPVLVEVHADAQAHARHTVHSAALALLAGLLHTTDSGLDFGEQRLHPWSRFAPAALDVLLAALGEAEPALASAAIAAAAAAAAPAPMLPVPAGVPPAVEKRCLAVAGLCDLCARPPSALLTPEQVQRVLTRLADTMLGAAPAAVRFACVRALCTMVSARSRLAAAALVSCVPRLLAAVAAAGSALEREAPLHALTQLCCASSAAVRLAVLPQLAALADADADAGSGDLAADSLSAFAAIAAARASAGDAAAVDALLSAGDAARTAWAALVAPGAEQVPLLLVVPLAVKLLVASARPGARPLSLRARAAVEMTLRIVATHASAPLQDALRRSLARLVLQSGRDGAADAAGEGAGAGAGAADEVGLDDLKVEAPWFAPLRPDADAAQRAVLPALLTALACSRRGAPAPAPLASLVTRLAEAALHARLGAPLRSCEDPLLRGLAPSAALAAGGEAGTDGAAAADELALAAALEARGAAGEAAEAGAELRAAVLCAQTVGALLNKHAGEAGGAEAVAAVARIVADEAGLGPVAAPSAPAPASTAAELRRRGVLVCVWAAKGLSMRAHAGASGFVDALTRLLVADAGGDAGAEDADAEAALAALAGAGLGVLPRESPAGFALSRPAGAVGSPLFKQRLFESLVGLAGAGAGVRAGSGSGSVGAPAAAEGRAPLLLCLCAMSGQLPPAVVLGHIERLLPLVLRSLEVASAASPAPQGAGAEELRGALALAALTALRALVARAAPAVAASPHFAALIGRLLAFTTRGRVAVRAAAVDCIRGFATASVPFFRLKPVKGEILLGLIPALDDVRRAVRRRAAAARGDWSTLVA